MHKVLINKRNINKAICQYNNILREIVAVINFFAKIDHNSFQSNTFVSSIKCIR